MTRRSISSRNVIAVSVPLLFMLPQACSDTPPIAEPDTQAMIGQLLESLGGENENFMAPGIPQWPDDLIAHPDMRSESFSLQAVLAVADGKPLSQSPVKAGVMAQIDRVSIDRVAIDRVSIGNDNLYLRSVENKTESAWQYSDIMRSSFFIDASKAGEGATRADASASDRRLQASNASEPDLRQVDGSALAVSDVQLIGNLAQTQRTESVQRVALELAGASEKVLFVGNDRLSIELNGTDSNPCQRNYRWVASASAVSQIVLDFSLENCPESQSIGLFSRWHQSAIEVTGFC